MLHEVDLYKILKSISDALKTKQHYIMIATDGKAFETFYHGDNNKIIPAICTALDQDQNLEEIINAVNILRKGA